ncbi:hypothetical protein AB0C18_17300 [Nonomuraea muscovyensis]|uniref:Uncharacterized protein n=1 Tax=Nonomuraea muscovyensis TaxID=1124761 RepID=A0A7X0EYQ9_9ACTN|nr:hypothetical protein [Nonomuraea muscovyensis]MBB6349412.1 hypothetical protein [Nonomuraea muscovyensis]
MVTIKVECPDDVAAEQRQEFADTVIGAAVDLLGAERAGVRLDVTELDRTELDRTGLDRTGLDGARLVTSLGTTEEDEARARREAAFWAAAWSGC